MTTRSITGKARDAWYVLEAAELRGLPAPYNIDYSTLSPIRLAVHTPADVQAWAETLDADVDTSSDTDGNIHWRTDGHLYDDIPVAVYAVVTAAVTA